MLAALKAPYKGCCSWRAGSIGPRAYGVGTNADDAIGASQVPAERGGEVVSHMCVYVRVCVVCVRVCVLCVCGCVGGGVSVFVVCMAVAGHGNTYVISYSNSMPSTISSIL